MDIFNEIIKLPQYYYQWKSGWGIWGREYYNKERNGVGAEAVIIEIWKELKVYYEQDGDGEKLSDEEKRAYAKAVDRMRIYCEKDNLSDGDLDTNELTHKISTLSDEDRKEIEWQIDMYERGQRYYGEYIHNR